MDPRPKTIALRANQIQWNEVLEGFMTTGVQISITLFEILILCDLGWEGLISYSILNKIPT